MQKTTPCFVCNGTGVTISEKDYDKNTINKIVCVYCGGTGKLKMTTRVKVNVKTNDKLPKL